MGKTIVYCKSIKDCGRLFMFFKSQLGEHGYYLDHSPRTSGNLLFGVYHYSTLNKQKSIILNAFMKSKALSDLCLLLMPLVWGSISLM